MTEEQAEQQLREAVRNAYGFGWIGQVVTDEIGNIEYEEESE